MPSVGLPSKISSLSKSNSLRSLRFFTPFLKDLDYSKIIALDDLTSLGDDETLKFILQL